ncbi:MAG: hypothetical protein NXI20_14705 [bacterium]|nr:hypothetical protein [bacterium]
MGFLDNRLGKLIDTVGEMRESYITMSANFKHLETSYDKFRDTTEKQIEKIKEENVNISRRLTKVEGTIDSVLMSSTKEALQNIFREHLENNKNLPLEQEEVKKLLNKNKKSL